MHLSRNSFPLWALRRFPVRLIGPLVLILFGLGWLASEVPLPRTQPRAAVTTGWRRTRDGWEHSSCWTRDGKTRQPALHPNVVGLLEMFLAVAGLLALSKDDPSARRPAHRKRSAGRRRSSTGLQFLHWTPQK